MNIINFYVIPFLILNATNYIASLSSHQSKKQDDTSLKSAVLLITPILCLSYFS